MTKKMFTMIAIGAIASAFLVGCNKGDDSGSTTAGAPAATTGTATPDKPATTTTGTPPAATTGTAPAPGPDKK